jgi:hypothetical protein
MRAFALALAAAPIALAARPASGAHGRLAKRHRDNNGGSGSCEPAPDMQPGALSPADGCAWTHLVQSGEVRAA